MVDSDWLIDATDGDPKALVLLDGRAPEAPAISAISVAEVCEGAFGTFNPVVAFARIQAFLASFAILPVTVPIAERFAWLWSALRRQGMLIPDMDLLIAATALEHDLTLVTRNLRHFARVPELRLV